MAVDAYKLKSESGGMAGGGGGALANQTMYGQRGGSPSSGLPSFGESSGYRAYQQQVMSYWQNKESRNGSMPPEKRFKQW